MSRKIRLGILGGGGDSLVGILHRIATAMHNKYEIVGGVFNPNFDENLKFAKEIGLNENRIYEDFEKIAIVFWKVTIANALSPCYFSFIGFNRAR